RLPDRVALRLTTPRTDVQARFFGEAEESLKSTPARADRRKEVRAGGDGPDGSEAQERDDARDVGPGTRRVPLGPAPFGRGRGDGPGAGRRAARGAPVARHPPPRVLALVRLGPVGRARRGEGRDPLPGHEPDLARGRPPGPRGAARAQ